MLPTRAATASHSGLLATARALAAQPMPVDQTRVAELRQALGDGTYVVDPQSIARAMQGYGHG